MSRKVSWLVVAGLIAGLVLSVQPVSAQGTGLFIEGIAGYGRTDLGNTSGWSMDKNDTNWGLGIGYLFNDTLGIEAGYRDLGSVSGSTSGTVSGSYYGTAYSATGTLEADAHADGLFFGGRLNIPLGSQFSGQLRAGWFHWHANVSVTATGTLTYGGTTYAANAKAKDYEYGIDPYGGIGVKYDINKQVSAGLGYSRFKVDTVDVDSADINLGYRF